MSSAGEHAVVEPLGRTLPERLRAGDRLVGALLRMPSEDLLEMLAVAGVDVVVVDCEHGPADVGALRRHITVADVHGVPVLVRIGRGEAALALRALDQGAAGVVAPHVDSPQEAEALVSAVHYPPLGSRGFATYTRAGRFGTVAAEDHLRRARRATLVVAMLESPAAVADAAAILDVPGVDAYLLGTADLAAARTPEDPPLPELVATARREAGSRALRVDLVGSPAQAADAFADGAQLVVYNTTQLLMGLFATLRAPSSAVP
jgi:4-hydroxy-2-oxoheptanedioate aldolase